MSDDLVKRLRQPTGLNAVTREPVQDKLNMAAADRIEELEAKLQAVIEDKVDVVVELTKLKTHLEDFFALLEITEQKEDGRYFHPTTIRSSRALDAEKLKEILGKLRGYIND